MVRTSSYPEGMSRPVVDPAHHALVSQALLRAANDGYDVSPLIENGADPMASGAARSPAPSSDSHWREKTQTRQTRAQGGELRAHMRAHASSAMS